MKNFKVGDLVLHEFENKDQKKKCYFCSVIKGFVQDGTVMEIETKFTIIGKRKIKSYPRNGRITFNNLNQKKLKKLLKKYPEHFI